jgi:hypothetical protein
MRRIRPRSVYDVLALISFCLVLGGGTALASYVISSNGQVGPGTISGHNPTHGHHANIISGSVGTTDLAGSAVRAAKLGPITRARTDVSIANGRGSSAVATCPAGTRRIGGGANNNLAEPLDQSYPNSGEGWVAGVENTSGHTLTLTAFVLCLDG